MLNQTISWTVLPRGSRTTNDGKRLLLLSVMISPRLDPGTAEVPLSAFAPFGPTSFADWPPPGLSFDVTFGGAVAPSRVVAGLTPVGLVPNPGVWHALFPPTRPVRPFGFKDLSRRRLLSFPSLGAAAALRAHYAPLLQDTVRSIEMPTLAFFRDKPRADLVSQVLDDAVGFFSRAPRDLPAPLAPPELDFHEELAALGSFPAVCRQLGTHA